VSGVHFLSVGMFFLLWSVPLIIIAYVYEANRRKRMLKAFADSEMLARLNRSVDTARRSWKKALTIVAYIMIIAALVRPAWNPKPRTVVRRGRDVVFIVDVSRSMLAEDLAPNRLDRAKYSIIDTIERLQGDRVGLIAFAGTAAVKCPLTLDYGFFRTMLERLFVDSIERGGSLVGDAIRRAIEDVFDDQEKRFKDIVLITDGEDHDSFPVDAAAEAGERGIRIIAIGLGDENIGRRIPVTDEQGRKTFVMHEGQEVWTRLDADTLREVANATPGGRYINVATGAVDLGDIYTKLIASSEKKMLASETVQLYEEKFQVFLSMAVVALLAEMAIPHRRRKRKDHA
jgi:Ca-activated chloride channel homolog